MMLNPFMYESQQLIGVNTGMNLSFNVLKSMMKEADKPLTDVAVDTDPVGLVYDQTINGLILRSSGNTARPLLGSDATRNSYVTFDGTNDNLTVLTSLSFMNTFWETVPSGTILIWLKMNGGDGTSQGIINSWGTLATNPGLNFIRASTNKLLVRAGNGAIKWTYTSTTDVVAATGWVGLIVSVNGVGASTGRFILINSAGTTLEDATFAVAAGSTINAQTSLRIGMRESDLYLNGSISAIIVENFPVTDQLIQQFKDHNPERISAEFPPIVQWLLDMNNSAFIFSDAAGTTPATNGDVVRVMRSSTVGNFNTTPTFGALRRIFASTSDATSAIYRTNQINGHATIEFDGVDDNYDLSGTQFIEELSGKNTVFIVMKNDDVTFGSHPMAGNNYVTLTGSGYTSGAGLTYPYFVVHSPTIGESVAAASERPGVDDFKVMVWRRNGTTLDAWNGDKVKYSDTSNDNIYFTDIGQNGPFISADWWMDGHIAYIKKYNGVLTDAEIENEIDALNTRFGL